MYYIYVLRCCDNTLYTGITVNYCRRMAEHFGKTEKCAKYTASHPPIKIEMVYSANIRAAAARLEYRMKMLAKKRKEALISGTCTFCDCFSGKLNESDFCRLYPPCR